MSKCKICKKPVSERYKPFCSKRCTDVDLNRWLSAVYLVPGRDGEAHIVANDVDPDKDPELQ